MTSSDGRAESASRINFSWLIRLRWGAVAGQIVTVLGVERLMHVPLPMTPLFAIIAVELLTNVACALAERRVTVKEWWIGALMALDTLLLTGLLYFAGGPFNPFSFLYLVQIALAAVILPERWTWALVVLSLAGSGLLFVEYQPLALGPDHMTIHVRGMWVAFGVAAAFIVYFLMRVRRALQTREQQLLAARELAARQQRLASLATLAAGAAHELSTPLSTIAVVAKELERQLGPAAPATIEDVRLIRSELDRCRAILDRMAAEAGESAGEGWVEIPVVQLVEACVRSARPLPQVRIELTRADSRLTVPARAIAQAVGSLVKNAQDASTEDGEVILRAAVEGEAVRIEVEDSGSGMSPETLARAGEPFFTTKPAGKGMGLGLFLTRAIVERMGGRLELHSDPGRGTRASIKLPANFDRMFGEPTA
jgi:two-component system, sensor histidine kinase RegB